MATSCMVASLANDLPEPYDNHGKIFRLGHHGQILLGSITNDLLEPYDNLSKIVVRSLRLPMNLTRF